MKKIKFIKGTTVCIKQDGEMTGWQTNLSHDIEANKGDTFSINWGRDDQYYILLDTDGFMIIAEELED